MEGVTWVEVMEMTTATVRTRRAVPAPFAAGGAMVTLIGVAIATVALSIAVVVAIATAGEGRQMAWSAGPGPSPEPARAVVARPPVRHMEAQAMPAQPDAPISLDRP